MGEPALGHVVVCLKRALDVLAVHADGDAHVHVLRPLRDLAVQLQQVAPLERLEAKVVEVEVAVEDDARIELFLVLANDGPGLLREQRSLLAVARVDILVQVLHHI